MPGTSPPLGAGPATASGAPPTHGLALAVMLTATLVVALDVFIVFVATPSIAADLGASGSEMQWVVAAYGLAFALGLVTGGRLGDLYGRRLVFVVGLTVFGIGSGLCGAAPSAVALIVARAVQGVGAALMMPQIFSIIQVEFSPAQRGRPLAAVGIVQGVAAVGGQLLGALLIELNPLGLEWRSLFLINLPICAAGILASGLFVPESRSATARRPDLAGVGLSLLAVGALMVPLVEGHTIGWPAWALASLAATVPLSVAFLAWERRTRAAGGSPLISLELFSLGTFRLGIGLSLLFFTSVPAVILILMVYMQDGLGLSPMGAGLTFTPAALGFSLAAWLVGRLRIELRERSLGPGVVVTILGVLASAALAAAVPEPGPLALAAVYTLIGLGHGILVPALNGTVLSEAPAAQAGSASGLLTTAQQLGGALGVAVAGSVFFGYLDGGSGPAAYGEALAAAYLLVAALLCVAAVLVRRIMRLLEAG